MRQSTEPSPFGQPLFDGPEARALTRVGVIDVGSNSVRLVVFNGAARSPAYFFNEKVMCGLGAGLNETGKLNPEGRKRARAALERFVHLAKSMNASPLATVATAAVREAEDGPEFCAEISRDLGLDLYVVDGREEARLSAQGVLLGWPDSQGLVCDIGGSSMEIARIEGGKVGERMTSDLGPLKLMSLEGSQKTIRATIRARIEEMHATMGETKGERLFLVGGSWRAIARIDMDRRGYALPVLHEYRMHPQDIRYTCEQIERNDLNALRSRCRISSSRMSLVPHAAIVLRELVKVFKPKDICISSYGIREGMLYEQMPEKLRDRDPLLESCWYWERKEARIPGFGDELFAFVKPIFSRWPKSRLKIVKAACLLHDVAWRGNPDFRAEYCFEFSTKGNFGAITHRERIFLGLALMRRYSSKSVPEHLENSIVLISRERRVEAEILGKAMRLGAMLWVNPNSKPPALQWQPKKRVLTLVITPDTAPLIGEAVKARLNSLASSLDATWKCKIVD